MNRKQFFILSLALAIISTAGFVVLNRHKQSWSVREAKVGEKLLPNFRPNDVAAIHIKGSTDLNIENKDGAWRVRERGNYPANYEHVKSLLVRMKDIKIVQSDEIGPSQRPRVELGEPGNGSGSGALIEFEDGQGKVLDSLLVGKRHMRAETRSDPYRMRGLFDGCYVLLPKEPSNVLLISDELAGVSGEAGAWLNTEFVRIENVKSVSLTGADGTNLWMLARESDSKSWTLADAKSGEMLDNTKVAQTIEMLNFLGFVDLVPGVATSGFDKPKVLLVETFDQFSYMLKLANPQKGSGNYQLAIDIKAEIVNQRVTASDEKAEDKQRLDEEFRTHTRRLRDKLARESRFASSGWNYLIEPRLINPLLCQRTKLLENTSLARLKDAGKP